VPLLSPIRATCPSNPSLIDMITRLCFAICNGCSFTKFYHSVIFAFVKTVINGKGLTIPKTLVNNFSELP
jgi:hypothetical protein